MRRLAILGCCAVIGSVLGLSAPVAAQDDEPQCGWDPITIFGTEGNDRIVGTPGDDVIHALGGNDVVFGRGGNDVICGGTGRDRLIGGSGSDRLDGGPGRDKLRGGQGADWLWGGDSHDRSSGGPGNDWIADTGGNDVLRGGKGADLLDGGAGTDRCDGDAGFDGAGADCERHVSIEIRPQTQDINGLQVHYVGTSPELPERVDTVAFSTGLIDYGDGPVMCIGLVASSDPPGCGGPRVEGLEMDPAWAQARLGVVQGSRLVTVTWPMTADREVQLLAERTPFPVGTNSLSGMSTYDPDLFARPAGCEDLTFETSTTRRDLVFWGRDNPNEYADFWLSDRVAVLQVKATPERIAEITAELSGDGRTPCIIGVDFTQAELNATQAQVTAARQDGWSSWGSNIISGRVEIDLFMIDGEGVQALIDAVDRPDLVEVRVIGIVGGFE